MKRNSLLGLVVLLMAIASVWLVMSRRSGTIREELRNFSVPDTGAIVRIFLADKAGNKVLLERQPNGDWLLGKKDIARADGIQLLLTTLHDVEVRSPVARAAYNNVIRTIAGNGIKVELYTNEGLLKTIYVGGPTQDQYGTFMYLDNSSAPFIVHIPGFEGYLTPRFSVNAEDWRIKKVFRLAMHNLKRLSVADMERPGYAFTITQPEHDQFLLADADGKQVADAGRDKILSYLEYFTTLNYETSERTLSPGQIDSLHNRPPFRTVVLEEQDGTMTRLDLWRRPQTNVTVHKINPDGVPYPYDIDRMDAVLNRDSTILVVQYFSYEKLFKSPADFRVPKP